MSYIGVLAVGLIISFYFCYERRKGFSSDLLILKTISSLGFLLFGFVAIALTFKNGNYSFYGPCILFGGILGLCGDIFLDLKGVHEEFKDKYMMVGFVSFFICHIFYNLAIYKFNGFSLKWIILCIIISLIVAAINISLDKKLQLEYGKYKFIVFAYSSILILTTVSAIFSMILNGYSAARLLMLIGGVMFILSDVILSYTFFKKNCDGESWYIINHLTYYIAQYAIMSSIIFVK